MDEHTEPSKETRRQVVKFSFYRMDPAWRGLPQEERERGKQELCDAVEAFAERLQVRSYSVVGMRGDVDFLLWQIGDGLDEIQAAGCRTERYSDGAAPHDAALVPGDDAPLGLRQREGV